MRLKRLELFGFKSFADRASLDFRHDLVGIVGPNGCGKSNVVDAVRWVLGEQRPTSMRGDEMTDVIFKGSASRPALAVAEVSLVLDNSAGMLAGRGPEVAITRRVYRSGEGEYLIDAERVRLKDVREMLFGTGLGSRGYSVLEQGKIDAVLSVDPLERRAIFEEAAGISRYRQRKKETESRLERVDADLARLSDVVGELEKRQRSLKIQATRARRWLELRDELRAEGLRLARHQFDRLRLELERTAETLADCERTVEEHRGLRGSAEEEAGLREGEIRVLSGECERVARESNDLALEVRAMDERRTHLASQAEASERAAESEEARRAELEQRSRARRDEAAELDLARTELETALAEAREGVRVLSNESVELFAELQATAADIERRNAALLALFQELTAETSRREHLEHSLEPLAERERRTEERLTQVREELRAARETIERVGERQTSLAERVRFHEEVRAERLREESEASIGIATLDERRGWLELESARLSSRIDSLRDWEREREGLEAGAQDLLRSLEAGEGPRLARELSGLLADHLRTTSVHARALDAALGDLSQAFVAAGQAEAARILAWLKARGRGRVALVVPELELPGVAELPAGVLGAPGVEGRLLDVVRVAPGFERLAAWMLGRVVLARDGAAALELAAEHPELVFVTSEGDRIEAGAVRGGHVEVAQGAVGRRSVADELVKKREPLEAELATVRERLTELRARGAEATRRAEEARATLATLAHERAEVEAEARASRGRATELEERVREAERECEGLAHERDAVDDELFATRERVAELERAHGTARAEPAELEAGRRALDAERNQRTRDEGQSRAALSGLEERREALDRRREDLARAARELEAEIDRTRKAAVDHLEGARAAEAELARMLAARDQALERRGEIEEHLLHLRSREREGREALVLLRRRSETLTQGLERELEGLSRARLEHQRLSLAREEVARRAVEDLGLDPASWMAGFEPEEALATAEALAALEARVTELIQSLDKIGLVNVEAVQELDEVSGRLGFLQEQLSDLAEAKRALEGTIEKLNEESVKRFREAFEAIRTEFRAVFRQLFGGGRADVVLLQEDAVLDSGIEIIARPPGRESLPITLLSGGQRTLTALALLFAVFRTKASPFCILDEVDAALDDANIGRFLSLVESSLGGTQYVIVTHNKGTMAACQMLYGVTMAVRGVSHVVSVELDEVEEIVPAARVAPAPAAEETPSPAVDGGPIARGTLGAAADEEPLMLREIELVPGEGVREVGREVGSR
jgi:chromosome segregation protein